MHVETTYPMLVFDDVRSYGGQRGPFAIRRRSSGASLVSLALAYFARQSMGWHTMECFSAHVAVCGSRM